MVRTVLKKPIHDSDKAKPGKKALRDPEGKGRGKKIAWESDSWSTKKDGNAGNIDWKITGSKIANLSKTRMRGRERCSYQRSGGKEGSKN